MNNEQALNFVHQLLKAMIAKDGSDLFITAGFPPAIKTDGEVQPVTEKSLTPEQADVLVKSIMNERQRKEFAESNECNFAIAPEEIGRFRVNAFIQQGHSGAVLRTINTEIPDADDLGLPEIMKELMMTKRGLILMVGATGSGKSTSLAAMVGHRNANSKGHIITIEDPIEYVHPHRGCIVMQREVGVDTESWHVALKNTLRQAPDVILIGEIRDRETMEHAIALAETGHLCISTLDANNANQAMDRIINFFPEERKNQLLMDLSMNLQCIVSQRLVTTVDKKRCAAIEVLLGTPMVSDLILKGEIDGIKEVMEKSENAGMKTFDTALFELYQEGLIDEDEALRNADSPNNVRLKIKFAKQDKGSEEGAFSLERIELGE